MNESKHENSPAPYDDEIELRELFRVLWAGKWLVGSLTLASTIIALILVLTLPNIYRAEALLAPNDQEAADGLSALAAQYGGLAGLAGINIGGSATDETAVGLAILNSRKFISEFINRHDILVPLMAAKGWNLETGELIIDSDDFDVVTQEWKRDVTPPKKLIPSDQEAYQEFMDLLSVSQDKKSGFVTIAVEHYSPRLAKQWVDWLVQDINLWVMQQEVSKAEQAIEYLNQQIEAAPLVELQNVFFGLIEEQIKTIVLAKVSEEYLFKTLDPAVVAEKKTKPNRGIMIFIWMVFGFVIGVIALSVGNMRRA